MHGSSTFCGSHLCPGTDCHGWPKHREKKGGISNGGVPDLWHRLSPDLALFVMFPIVSNTTLVLLMFGVRFIYRWRAHSCARRAIALSLENAIADSRHG